MGSSQGAGKKGLVKSPPKLKIRNHRAATWTLLGNDSVFLVDTEDGYIAEFKELVHKKKDTAILRDVNASDLTVLKVDETLNGVPKDSLRRHKFKAGENGAEELAEWESASKYWTRTR